MYRIRRIGVDSKHDRDFSINRPTGYDCYLLLFVKTKALFFLDGKETVCEPNTFILFNINSAHKYKSINDEYVNDWIQFDSGDVPNVPLDKLIYVGNSVDLGKYIKLISDSFYRRNERACSLMIRALLAEISFISGNAVYRSAYSNKLIELRKEVYAHPERDWSVSTMAKLLHVSEPYLQELYKGLFGISCGTDIINGRVEAAKLMLSDTFLSITEIGIKCGYNSTVHFSRQFKKVTGLSPSEYRKKL